MDDLRFENEVLRAMGHAAIQQVGRQAIRPDKVIGPAHGKNEEDYLCRWHLQRDRQPVLEGGMGNIYLHRIGRGDSDRHLHNHPWSFHVVILQGAYLEETPEGEVKREEGDAYTRTPDDFHRLVLPWGPVWTLFITGPWIREWGFHTEQGFIPWRDYLDVPVEAGT